MKALLLLIISISLYGISIDKVIDTAYKNNPTIKKLQEQILSKDYDILNSDLYKNPVVTIGVNDINLDEPKKRDLEAMQTNFISFSQEITWSDKLKLKTKIEHINKNIIKLLLKEEKNKIAKDIYNLYFTIEELNKKIQLNNKILQNTQKIKNYNNNQIQNTKAFQSSIQNDIMIDKTKLKIESYKELISQKYAHLLEIINKDISNISIKKYPKYKDQNSIKKHPILQIQNTQIDKALNKKDLAIKNKTPNYTISGGYYNRDSFDDYINIALKFPINIYSREKNQVSKSKKLINVEKSKYNELKNKLIKNYKISLSQYNLANKSIEFTKKIIKHLKKEKELISKQNYNTSILQILNLDNKILKNSIDLEKYKKDLFIAQTNLSYLTSSLTKD